MAEDVKVNLEVNTGGTIAAANKDASKLETTLKGAAAASQKIRVPAAVAAARAGVAASYTGSDIGNDSSLSRGIGGQTGAAGRDFAAQVQGLGGLVRVYATFAANLFAITAAFGALSKAADTTNLVKGMDQLGAASGRNLGTLAKQLAAASDGAISLRDSLSATALATSGGMSSQNLLRLGNVAKTASQALGISMPDAVSRLSRGITKLEPELLDELGILVRVDTASQNYARSIGKSASALTDFEKRQGFANEVLAQGEKKFGAISLDANPYDKVLASIQNLSQSGLELVNKVLGPIAGFLASSPTALATVLAGIVGLLLKQAIPALGQYRAALADAAEASRQKLARIYKDQQALGAEADAAAALRAEKSFQQQASIQKRLADLKLTLQAKNSAKDKTDYNAIANKGAFDLTEQELSALDKRASNLKKRQSVIDQAEGDALKQHLGDIRKLRAESDQIGFEASNKSELKASTRFAYQTQLVKIFDRANQEASARAIQAATAEAAATLGPVRAYKLLNEEIAKRKTGTATIAGDFLKGTEAVQGVKAVDGFFGAISNGAVRAKGLLTIATSALSTFANAFQGAFFIIGALVGTFQILDSILSKNTKEAQATANAFDALHAASLGVDNTMESISKKDPLAAISTESINARATALNELTINISSAFDKIKMQVDKANWWDILLDTAKASVGVGLLAQSAKEFSLAITKEFKAASEGADKAKALKNIGALLGVDPTDAKAIDEILSESPEKFLSIAPKVVESLKQMNSAINNIASRGSQLDAAFTIANKTVDSILVSAIPSDPFAKLGTETITVAREMSEALKDPVIALNQLSAISTDVSKLRFFSPETGTDLIKNSQLIKENVAAISAYSERLAQLDAEERVLAKRRDDSIAKGRGIGSVVSKGLADISQNRAVIEQNKAAAEATLSPILSKFIKSQDDVFLRGATQLNASIGTGFARAANSVQKTLADALGNTIGGIQARAKIQKEDINIQLNQLKSTTDLIEANERLRLAVEESSIMQQKVLLRDSTATAEEKDKQEKELNIRLAALTVSMTRYSARNASNTLIKDLKGNNGATPEEAEINKRAAQGAQSYVFNKAAQESSKAGLRAQIQSVDINAEIQKAQRLLDLKKDGLVVDGYVLNVEKTIFDLYSKSLDFSDARPLANRQNIDAEIAANKVAQERLAIEKELTAAKLVAANPLTKDKTNAQNAISELEKQNAQLTKKAEADSAVLRTQGYFEQQSNAKKIFDYEQANSKILFDLKTSNQASLLTQQEEGLTKLATLGGISEEDAARQDVALKARKEELRNATEIYNLKTAQSKAEFELNQQLATAIRFGTANEEAAAQAKLSNTTAYYNAAIAGENAISASRLSNIEQVGKLTIELAKQATLMQQLVDLTNSLGVAFGDVGTNIGKALESIVSFANTESAYQAKKAALQEANNKVQSDPNSDAKDKLQASQELDAQLNKLNSTRTKQELAGIAAIAGASKNLFKEKTFAYKALSAVEKASHVASIAIMLAENAATIASIPGKIASGVASLFSQGGFVGFVGAAAFIALMASLGFGSSKGGVSAGASAKDQQAVQGTGQQYNESGTLVNRGGGVLGDSTAIAKSIDSSIDEIEKHSFKNLEYSNKMLDSLKSIKTNTDGLSQVLIQAGVTVGNSGNVQLGVTDKGATQRQVDPAAGYLFQSGSGLANFGDKLANSIFGGKTTVSIIDTGVIIRGTLGALVSGAKDLATQYTNIQKVIDGGWFRSDRTETSTITNPLQQQANEYLTSMFGSIRDTIVSASEVLGKDTSVTKAILDGLQVAFRVSALGLKPDELAKAINGEISIAFNQAAEAAFPELAKFRSLGEEMGATVIRLARDSQLTTLALTSIGKALTPLSLAAKTEVVENLIKLSGGIDTFLSNTESYKSNFLTAAEQLVPIQLAVTKEMTRLGLAGVTTREEFANVVKGLDLTQPAAQQLYTDLLNVSSAFAEVYAETRKVLTVQEIQKAQTNQEIDILKLEGRASASLAKAREQELASLDSALVAGQKYIYQLQDRATETKLEVDLLAALGDGYGSLLVSRELELRSLTDSERVLKKQIYAAQDAAKTDELYVQLLEATGNATAALNAKRRLEIQGLSASDAAIKSRIYKLQDETALKAKLKTAYDKEAAAIKSTIDGLKNSVKALADYKESLKLSDKSTLTPVQRYEQTKAEAVRIAALASSIAVTEAQKTDKQAAINELPAATDAFLEASRIIYASSEQYTRDFNTVLDLISTTGSVLSNQQTDAEKQLAALDNSVSALIVIQENTQTTSELLTQLLQLQSSMYINDVLASTSSASNTNSVPATIVQQFNTGIQGLFATLLSSSATPSLGTDPAPVIRPEGTNLVDPNISLTRPTVITDNNQAVNLALLDQITALRNELAGLRADQQEQTGHILQITQDTTNQLITAQQAISDIQASEAAWAARNVVLG